MARIPSHPKIASHFKHPPEWRQNPTTGEWVIMAPERAGRPMSSLRGPYSPAGADDSCPFCAGHEWRTPPELLAYRNEGREPNGPGWRVRVVPNSFAAVHKHGNPAIQGDGFFLRADGVGRHELFIECPHHETNLAELPVEHIREVVQAWRDRLLDARRDPHLLYAQLFKNHGPDAGASVPHAHSQLIATPMVPITLREEIDFAERYFKMQGECIYCSLIHREKVEAIREVHETANYVAIAAYAARQPFETWIIPKRHHSQFELCHKEEADDLGTILWTLLKKMQNALDGPSYNLVFHSGPFHQAPLPYYHWHVEVLPRLTQLAGYEWGTGSHVNPILPEDAAAILYETRP